MGGRKRRSARLEEATTTSAKENPEGGSQDHAVQGQPGGGEGPKPAKQRRIRAPIIPPRGEGTSAMAAAEEALDTWSRYVLRPRAKLRKPTPYTEPLKLRKLTKPHEDSIWRPPPGTDLQLPAGHWSQRERERRREEARKKSTFDYGRPGPSGLLQGRRQRTASGSSTDGQLLARLTSLDQAKKALQSLRDKSTFGDIREALGPLPEGGGEGGRGEGRAGSEEPMTTEQRERYRKARDELLLDDSFNPHRYFRVQPRYIRKWTKGYVQQRSFRINIIRRLPKEMDLLTKQQRIYAILEAAFGRMLATAPKNCKAQVVAINPKFDKIAVATCLKRVSRLRFNHLSDRIGAIVNSDEGVDLTETVFDLITIQRRNDLRVGGYRNLTNRRQLCQHRWARSSHYLYNPSLVSKRCSLDTALQRQMYCIPIIVCRELALQKEAEKRGVEKSELRRGKNAMRQLYDTVARNDYMETLLTKTELTLAECPLTLEKISKFSPALPEDTAINLFDSPAPPIFRVFPSGKSFRDSYAHHINIFLAFNEPTERPTRLPRNLNPSLIAAQSCDYHAYGITKLANFLSPRPNTEVCYGCFKTYGKNTRHRCANSRCPLCLDSSCSNQSARRDYFRCKACRYVFGSLLCQEAHKKDCARLRRCPLCHAPPSRCYGRHKCGLYHCDTCRTVHRPQQLCCVRGEVGEKGGPAGAAGGEDGEGADGEPPQPRPAQAPPPLEPAHIRPAPCQSPPPTLQPFGEEDEGEATEDQPPALLPQGANPPEAEEPGGQPGGEGWKKKPFKIFYADAESVVDKKTQEHQVNLVVVQQNTMEFEREYCGFTAMRDFVKELMQEDSPYTGGHIVFHNAAGYDGHLWLKEVVNLKTTPRHMIRRGQKLVSVKLHQNGIVLRDSLQFVPGTPLWKFSKLFDLSAGDEKGDFPHALNNPDWVDFSRPDNWKHYEEVVEVDGKREILRFPSLHLFEPDSRSIPARARLIAWHSEQAARYAKNATLLYYPQRELVRYCRLDVKVLRLGFEVFRAQWLKLYPDLELLNFATLPSFTNAVLRKYYLRPGQLAILPPTGYSDGGNRPSPPIAQAWFAWKARLLRLSQQRTARKGGEIIFNGHSLDGFGVDQQGQQHAFNFHGCWYHGHGMLQDGEECWDAGMRRLKKDQWGRKAELALMAKFRRKRTEDTDQDLIHAGAGPHPYGGFDYHVIWECQLAKERQEDSEMDQFIRAFCEKLEAPLNPREAMRGGRTNVIQHKITDLQENEGLYYFDFTSIYWRYPAVNAGMKGEKYPTGHPIIYIGHEMGEAPKPRELLKLMDPEKYGRGEKAEAAREQDGWWGLVKAKLVPPPELFHPVLPVVSTKGHKKVLFPLCRTCAFNGQKKVCRHGEDERAVEGTWFTEEVDLAMRHGYRLLTSHELWHWPPDQRSSTLFRKLIFEQYRNKVAASKQDTSSPAWKELQEELKSMGVELREDQLHENAAMRALAKFTINNIWGFFGARTSHEQTDIVQTQFHLEELEGDPGKEITRLHLSPDQESLYVCHRDLQERPTPNQCIAVAILTTSYARMHLYELIHKYSKQTVYFGARKSMVLDTDSVIMALREGVDELPATNNRLGGLKNEITETHGKGAKLTQFISLGPKCYTLEIQLPDGTIKQEFKLKGIHLTHEVASDISPQLYNELVGTSDEYAEFPQRGIKKDLLKQSIQSYSLMKKLRFLSTKRVIDRSSPRLKSYPYGYIGPRID